MPTARTHLRPRAALLAGALVVTAGLAACGDDADDDVASDTTEAAQAGGGSSDAYCGAAIEVDQVFQSVDPSDPDSFVAALEEAVPLAEVLVAEGPEEVADDLLVLQDAVEQALPDGDFAPFTDPAFDAADEAVHASDLEFCDLTQIDVTATDYHFDGDLPTEAGRVSFELTNEGAETHLLILARKHDDVDGTALEAFEAIEGEEDFPGSFDEVLTVFAEPGGADYGLGELTAGEYILFCPIPVGSTGEIEGDGPPHFVEGMVEAFEIS